MKLQTLVIDTEKNLCELNGIDISKYTHELHLDFQNGVWSLVVIQTKTYTTSHRLTME